MKTLQIWSCIEGEGNVSNGSDGKNAKSKRTLAGWLAQLVIRYGAIILFMFCIIKTILNAAPQLSCQKINILSSIIEDKYFLISIALITLFFINSALKIYLESTTLKIICNIFDKKPIQSDIAINKLPKNFDADNDDITLKVYRRLKLRYGILNSMLVDAKKFEIGEKIPTTSTTSGKSEEESTPAMPKEADGNAPAIITERLYKLATTDLFVEKALSYLNRKARKYERYSTWLIVLIFLLFGFAIGCSFYSVHELGLETFISHTIAEMWAKIAIVFIKNFTFYGIIIIAITFLYRMIRSLFDQAERIKDRRHALRQGRLFIHLKGGEVNLEEMKEAFNWNTTQPNAFSDFNPDAQAPFGALLKETLTTVREGVKTNKG